MSDLEALWRAVLANPDEDTPRLMYADEVQESDPERAELIRAQCELAAYHRRGHGITYRECPQMAGNVSGHCDECEKALVIESRATALLSKANRERWEPACVVCGGNGKRYARNSPGHPAAWLQCTACSGTGRQPCRWERGFPVVQVAQMRDAWRVTVSLADKPQATLTAPRWEPTPWLCALLRTHHVAGVVPGDVLPFFHQARPAVTSNQSVPPAVLARCSGFYRTPEEATAALGRAVVLAALEWLDAREAT